MKKLEHIRPYQVLGIHDEFPEEIRFFMPPAQGAVSLLSIESLLLIKLLRITQPKYLFEFGTYKGLTTRLLLANLPQSEQLWINTIVQVLLIVVIAGLLKAQQTVLATTPPRIPLHVVEWAPSPSV